MATNYDTTYYEDRNRYYKVIVGLLLLTTVTFIQPHMFLENATFGIQLLIALFKAWLIVMYYMHLKGEKLIGATVMFAITLVAFFFITIIADVKHFQFKDASYISTNKGVAHEASHEE